jgi:hypothetical protein
MGLNGKSPSLPFCLVLFRDKWEEMIGSITNDSLFAVSEPFAGQITRRKPTSDPMPPSGSGKDKILYTEAVGLVMIDYGDAVVGGFGKWASGLVLYIRRYRQRRGEGVSEGGWEKRNMKRRKLIDRGQPC